MSNCHPIVIPMTVELSNAVVIPGEISATNEPIIVASDVAVRPPMVSEYDEYEGAYVVTPDFDSQILETKNKVMSDDVVVDAIYVSRTTNQSGGRTIYIGGRVDG